MRKVFFFSVSLFIFILFGSLSAQEGNWVPHVSQIRVEARNNLVRLTWIDSPDAQGPVYIYRSARPFSGSVPPNIRPVVVRYGAQYFIDETDGIENLFYFIAASEISGQRYDVIIPQVNSTHSADFSAHSAASSAQTGVPVASAAGEQPHLTEQMLSGAAEAEPAQEAIYLMARLDGEKAVITFNIPNPHRRIVLFRSMHPLRQPQDLLNAAIVYAGTETAFTDYPAAGLTWYYAAIYEDEILNGNLKVVPGVNTIVSALVIHEDAVHQPMRHIPLPVLTLENLTASSFIMDFSPYNAAGDVSSIMFNIKETVQKKPLPLKKPRVFSIDMQEPAGGEESALFQIIKDYFEKYDWEGARISLQRYLSLPRSSGIEARARFYYGQALYYTGFYREALFEFLSFRLFDPAEANIWIDAVLSAMVY